MPDLYIITGANGAGKSSIGAYYLPKSIRDNYNIFDGDKLFSLKRKEIYKVITPSFKEAGRLATDWLLEHFNEKMGEALKNNNHFVYEGHLPDSENWKTPERFKEAGYNIHFIFFGLPHPKVSELRVVERAKIGGHMVPPYEIERNFYGNLYQLNQRFKFIDELQIIDTFETVPKILALFQSGEVSNAIHHGKLPEWVEKYLPGIYRKIVESEKDPFKGLSHFT